MKKLKKFFYPRSIAVIGASEHSEKVGGILMHKLQKFKGKIIPINPKHEFVFGNKCYPTITKYSGKIDLVIIATPAKTIKLILTQCARKKIKNIIIITAGFSEIGNTKQEKQITYIAKKYKLNILGPNCFGIVNTKLNLDTTFASSTPKKGNIALISQSGALWSYISDLNIGFSKFASLGNMSDIAFADLIKYLNKDKTTEKIICYIEKLKHGKKFIKVCKKSKKEIVVIKAGKSETGHQAAISHTGSLATNYNIYKSAFKQAKIKQANSIAQALKIPPIKINKKAKKALIITNAGGAGALISDILEDSKIKLVKPPIDILGTATAKDYKTTLNKLKPKNYDLIIVVLTPQKMSQPEETAQIITQMPYKKKVITFFLGDKSIKKAKEILEKNKIKCYTRI
jgi:acetyltransferase